MPDGDNSFREIDSKKDRPKARLGLVTLMRNEFRKIKNLIKSRPTRAETGLAGRVNGVKLHKE